MLLAGCSSPESQTKTSAKATESESASQASAVVAAPKPQSTPAADAALLALEAKPLYQFTPKEVDTYLKQLHATEPDMRKRMVTLARKNIDQPYELYLLGEAPFETTDNQPIYCLDRSDCVVFAEHTLAMAMSDSFPQFLTVLQRIRYKDGAIGVVTRNHYTEADWNVNNRWLEHDETAEIGGDAVATFTQKVNRAKFLQGRYKLENLDIPVETITEPYIPYDKIESAKSQLRDGDIVNFVNGVGDGLWVGHVGLVAHGEDGSVHLIHSSEPKVREETIESYIARQTATEAEKKASGKATFRGFKFLRLEEDPWANLKAIDGPDAPKVTVPEGSTLTFKEYISSLGG